MNRLLLIAAFIIHGSNISAQEYHGTTGLLQVPSADMDTVGTFRGGISRVDKAMLPDLTYYGDGIPFSAPCYMIGITFFSWLELSYACTLLKIHPNDDKSKELGYYNEDRHVNLKLRPLKEGCWHPAVALGWDDIGNFKSLKLSTSLTANNFFENLYIAFSKHVDIRESELGFHMVYRYFPNNKNKARRGIAGGITFLPSLGETLKRSRAWLQSPRLIIEWDGVGVNTGADVLLWRHLFVQVCLVHGCGFTGGLSYHYTIPF